MKSFEMNSFQCFNLILKINRFFFCNMHILGLFFLEKRWYYRWFFFESFDEVRPRFFSKFFSPKAFWSDTHGGDPHVEFHPIVPFFKVHYSNSSEFGHRKLFFHFYSWLIFPRFSKLMNLSKIEHRKLLDQVNQPSLDLQNDQL